MERVLTGNEAVAEAVRVSRAAVVTAYPITPQSAIAEKLAQFHAEGKLHGRFVNTESELSSLSVCIGASSGGARAFTATSSQGLALMHEQLHWASGSRLPIVMANVNRPLGAPWNLQCDQSDSLSQRDTGWLQFYCATNQEVFDSIIQAFRISEQVSLPSMVMLDGVFLSHTATVVEVPEQEEVDAYLPAYAARYARRAGHKLFADKPDDRPTVVRVRYFVARYQQHRDMSRALEVVERADAEFRERFGRGYPPVESYRMEDAEVAVVISGSAAGTCREVVEALRITGLKIGLVKMRLFRPFPRLLVRKALSGVKKVAVIDRNLCPGVGGIFWQEIKSALYGLTGGPAVYGFISGLGGEDITYRLVDKAIRFTLEEDVPEAEVVWLGLDETENVHEFDRVFPKIS